MMAKGARAWERAMMQQLQEAGVGVQVLSRLPPSLLPRLSAQFSLTIPKLPASEKALLCGSTVPASD